MAVTRLSAQRRRKTKEFVRRERCGADRRTAIRGMTIGLLIWAATLFIFYIGGSLNYIDLAPDQRAPATIVASADFTCEDLALTARWEREAADAVLPAFTVDFTDYHAAAQSVGELFEWLAASRAPEDARTEAPAGTVAEALSLIALQLPPDEARNLAPPGRENAVQDRIREVLRSVWAQGIVSTAERRSNFNAFAEKGRVTIVNEDGGLRPPLAVESLLRPLDAVDMAMVALEEEEGWDAERKDATRALLAPLMKPNLRYAPGATDAARAEAVKAVVTAEMHVSEGTTLVQAGEEITPQILKMVMAHDQRRGELEQPMDRFLKLVGQGSLLLLGLVGVAAFLRTSAPDLLRDPRALGLMALLAFLTLVPVKGLLYLSTVTKTIPTSLTEPLLPLALGPMLAAVLLGGVAAFAVGLWVSLAAALMFSGKLSLFFLGFVVTAVACSSARDVTRRASLLRRGLSVGLGAVAVMLCYGALNQQSAQVLVPQVGTALATGVACALFAVLFLPVFEWLFGLTTNITLLELSDMGHPLLRRLALEAPGTYHHSLMVANLAQAAAEQVGLNALLLRVCAYYHDVGKLIKPGHFAENNSMSESPHDDLSPSMSALVIMAHVKEGVALAHRYKLPPPIIDAIEQHHGKSLIYWFYHRAKELQQQARLPFDRSAERAVSEEDFRYPGPKPQTPEMGVLLLADAVEAASRSMEKPTPARLEALVQEIVDNRLRDGQLDQCALTFAQLETIRKSFLFTLANMFHGRVPYPKDEDRDQPPADEPRGRRRETEGLREVGHGAGTAA